MLSRLLILVVAVVILFSGFSGYRSWSSHQAIKSGRDKFYAAIAELHKTGINGLCIGTSVTRRFSFSQLSKKSVEEIKKLILEDPNSC